MKQIDKSLVLENMLYLDIYLNVQDKFHFLYREMLKD